jgi:photosystem II stability/assembly factor-like uncharacterized protein
MSGTSMASPITSGLAGLVKSLHPDWTPKQIAKQIRITSDNVLTTDPSQRNIYYGRSNAFNALNYNRKGGPVIPGIEISSVTLSSGDAITSYDPITIHLTVHNYLYQASQLNLNIKSKNNFVKIAKEDYTVGTLDSNSNVNIDITVQLQTNNLWYNGIADFIVTFTASGNYKDFQIIGIPIQIPSNNLYTNLTSFQDWQTVQWNSSYSPSKDVFWAVGTGNLFLWTLGNNGGYIRVPGSTNSIYSMGSLPNDVPNAIYAFDDQKAFIGSAPANTLAKIYNTTNGGSNWTSIGVENITPKVDVIHFFDNSWGMFIGDPKGTRFGIGVTNNGGKSWTPIPSGGPVILSGEAPYTTSTCFIGNNAWFGTSKGRVVRTPDKGNTWQVAAITNKAQNVTNVTFADINKGIAIYSETTSDKLVASTSDGGAHWTATKVDLTQLGYNPICSFKTDSSSNIYLLCGFGEVIYTTDLGTSWLTVLSEKDAPMNVGSYKEFGINRGRIWELGSTIGHLDFDYTPANATKELQLVSGDTVSYDTVKVGEGLIKPINIKNIGNVPVNILQVSVTPSGSTDSTEFTIFGSPPTSIDASVTKTLRVRFTPKDTSLRQASVNIYDDGIQPIYSVHLSGYGYKEPNAVNDNSAINNIIIDQNYPNPCIEETYVSFTAKENANTELSIINSLGETLKMIFNQTVQPGNTILQVSTNELPSGVYFFRLKTGSTVAYKKFVVAK